MFNLFKSNKLSSVITVIDIGSSKITCLIAKINEFLGGSILLPSFLLDTLILKSFFPILKFIKPNFFFK